MPNAEQDVVILEAQLSLNAVKDRLRGLPNSRECSLAVTKIEEAVHRLNDLAARLYLETFTKESA